MSVPTSAPAMWEHDRLKLYGKALVAVRTVRSIARGLPEGEGDMRDQLRRAGHSIVLNIAEGASEFSLGDNARFYRMARRSCAECGAGLDIVRLDYPDLAGVEPARGALIEINAMLTSLIKRPPPR